MKTFKKNQIHFSKKFLNQLQNDNNSCVTIERKSHHLSLHPFHFSDINNSIKDILSKGIAKYTKEFNGILLGYQNMKICESAAPIHDDTCFIHVNIVADFFVFKPEIDKILTGSVNKKSKDHVACLVHNIFNVSIPKPTNVEEWIGDNVQIGNEISFKITYLNLEARLPYIRAELISIIGGNSVGVNNYENNKNNILKFGIEDTITTNQILDVKSLKKKEKKLSDCHDNEIDENVEIMKNITKQSHETDNIITNGYASADPTHIAIDQNEIGTKIKKIKRRHSTALLNEESILELSNSKSPKKKRKKDNDIEDITNSLLQETLKNETKTKKKHEKDSYIEDMKNQLLQESLENGTNTKKLKRRRSSTRLNEEIALELSDSGSPKKKHKKDTDLEDIKNILLQETLENLNKSSEKKKRNRKVSRTSESDASNKSLKDNELKNTSNLQNISISPIKSKKKSKTKLNVDEITNSMLQESLEINKSNSSSKGKTRNNSELDISFNNTSINNALSSTKLINEDKIKTKKKKRSKSKIDVDEVTSMLLQELEQNDGTLHNSVSQQNHTINGNVTDIEEKRKSKKRKKDDDVQELTNLLLEESLKSISTEKIRKNKSKKKEKKSKKAKEKIESLSDLNIEALFQEEMNDIMS